GVQALRRRGLDRASVPSSERPGTRHPPFSVRAQIPLAPCGLLGGSPFSEFDWPLSLHPPPDSGCNRRTLDRHCSLLLYGGLAIRETVPVFLLGDGRVGRIERSHKKFDRS